jgi:hypothetical protein
VETTAFYTEARCFATPLGMLRQTLKLDRSVISPNSRDLTTLSTYIIYDGTGIQVNALTGDYVTPSGATGNVYSTTGSQTPKADSGTSKKNDGSTRYLGLSWSLLGFVSIIPFCIL